MHVSIYKWVCMHANVYMYIFTCVSEFQAAFSLVFYCQAKAFIAVDNIGRQKGRWNKFSDSKRNQEMFGPAETLLRCLWSGAVSTSQWLWCTHHAHTLGKKSCMFKGSPVHILFKVGVVLLTFRGTYHMWMALNGHIFLQKAHLDVEQGLCTSWNACLSLQICRSTSSDWPGASTDAPKTLCGSLLTDLVTGGDF